MRHSTASEAQAHRHQIRRKVRIAHLDLGRAKSCIVSTRSRPGPPSRVRTTSRICPPRVSCRSCDSILGSAHRSSPPVFSGCVELIWELPDQLTGAGFLLPSSVLTSCLLLSCLSDLGILWTLGDDPRRLRNDGEDDASTRHLDRLSGVLVSDPVACLLECSI